MVLEPDGAYSVYVGSSAIGQGLETAFAQIAADALEVPIDRIRGVFHGTTSYVSDGYGAYHSRSVVMGGSAMLDAADNLRAAIRVAAARRLGCDAAEVEIIDGSRRSARAASRSRCRSSRARASRPRAAFLNKKHTYTYGAHAAHVAVDPKIGHVELIDYVVVEDCGRIINPLTLRGQVIGSAVQGLGGALHGAPGLRRAWPAADRVARRLSDPDRERLSQYPCAWCWRTIPRRSTRSAPRAPAKAASSRPAG